MGRLRLVGWYGCLVPESPSGCDSFTEANPTGASRTCNVGASPRGRRVSLPGTVRSPFIST